MKVPYLFALTAAGLFIVDDTLRAALVFTVAFVIASVISLLYNEGVKDLNEPEKFFDNINEPKDLNDK